MAQIFVGTNNINLLVPNGQFGSRLVLNFTYSWTGKNDMSPTLQTLQTAGGASYQA
jgi:hypothetical protein